MGDVKIEGVAARIGPTGEECPNISFKVIKNLRAK